MIDMNKIREVATRIGVETNAEKVILFGSYAQGEATADSDVDFMIIANSDLPRFKRSRKIYNLFNPYPFGMDLLIYTPEEVEEEKKSPLSFLSTVLKEGRTLYVG
jgi:predicted nucleotidyltransferase